jgi:hypothetical protein
MKAMAVTSAIGNRASAPKVQNVPITLNEPRTRCAETRLVRSAPRNWPRQPKNSTIGISANNPRANTISPSGTSLPR